MNLLWIGIGIIGVIQFGAALVEYYMHDFKAITVIGNCLIPVLALFLVCLLNEMQRIFKWLDESSDDDC